MDKVDPLIGKQVGNYHILTKINAGSYGSVYQGKHIIFDDDPIVAIKVLHANLYTQQEQAEFIQEARILKKLQHPHILQILDAGFQDEIPYIVTEYAAGGSLRDHMDPNTNQLFPLQKTISILAQIGQALHYAHQQNIVHRDLKPENILFNAKSEALLADFGIAAVLSTAKTKPISLGGTPAYMAPEQFEGLISAKSDQYALGCICYELLTGHKPFNIASPNMQAWWYHHAKVNPISPREYNTLLPIYIEQAISRAMSKNRGDRFDNISTFIATICSPFSRSDDFTLFQTSSTTPSSAQVDSIVGKDGSIIPFQTSISTSSSAQISILPDGSNPGDGEKAKSFPDIYARLLKERIICIDTHIEEDISKRVIAQLLYLQSEDINQDINLYINSPGGNIYASLAIYYSMQRLYPDISTVSVGKAGGTAAILLAAGTLGKRYAITNSSIMFGSTSAKYLNELSIREVQRLNSEICKILAWHTGNSEEKISSDMNKGLILTSQAAVEYNIIDEILDYYPSHSSWGDDYNYNQDTRSSRETGRAFGSGKPQASSPTPQRTARPSSNRIPKLPTTSPSQDNKHDRTAPTTSKPKSKQYKPGEKIRHVKFGEGIILKSDMEQNTEFVEVQFQGKHGKKRLSMDFAKLEKI
jgi:ATP-dependent Clp endopeptidase proteolytic subunit ClpP